MKEIDNIKLIPYLYNMKKFFYSIPVFLILNTLALALCYHYWSFLAIISLSIFMIFYTEKALSWRKTNTK